jgi:hypothetical protein
VCGKVVVVEDRSKGRIPRSISEPADLMINSVDAIIDENPWQASISDESSKYKQKDEYDICGATLISKRFLITGGFALI